MHGECLSNGLTAAISIEATHARRALVADQYVGNESDAALRSERAANQRGLIEATRPHARPMQRNRGNDDIVAILGQMASQLLRNHAGQSDLSAIF